MPLTEAPIKSLRAVDSRVRKAGGGGLFVEVAPGGTKVFRLGYRFADRQRTPVIGHHPAMRLFGARCAREDPKGSPAPGG